MSDPQCHETPWYELVVHKCWSPRCEGLAIVRDGMGWWWCAEHLDRVGWDIAERVTYSSVVERIRRLSVVPAAPRAEVTRDSAEQDV